MTVALCILRRTLGLISALALACSALVACGSSAPAPAYVAQANHICATQLALLNAMNQPATPDQAVSYLPRALAIMRRENAQLSALHATPVKRAALDSALTGQRRLAAVLTRFLHQLRAGIVELTTFSHVQQVSDRLRTQINASFRRAGLPRCVQ
jgi:hypothetical protein